MRFTKWMKKNYISDPTAKGCLARSMSEDAAKFQTAHSHKKYLAWLTVLGADSAVLAAFEECWEEYEREDGENHKYAASR